MAIDVATFRIRFPEFNDETIYPDARIQLFIDDTIDYIGSKETRWCGKYDKAQAYLAAHLLSVGSLSAAGSTQSKVGAVSSKSAGGVSVSYSQTPTNRSDGDNFYLATSYGQQFMIIRNTCFAGVAVANANVNIDAGVGLGAGTIT